MNTEQVWKYIFLFKGLKNICWNTISIFVWLGKKGYYFILGVFVHLNWTIFGAISSDLYRASLCDIQKSNVRSFELQRNQ